MPARLDGTSLFLLFGVQSVDKPVESGSTSLPGARRGPGGDWVFGRKQLRVRTGSLQGLQSKVSCGKEYCYDNRMTMQYAVPDQCMPVRHLTHAHGYAYACTRIRTSFWSGNSMRPLLRSPLTGVEFALQLFQLFCFCQVVTEWKISGRKNILTCEM